MGTINMNVALQARVDEATKASKRQKTNNKLRYRKGCQKSRRYGSLPFSEDELWPNIDEIQVGVDFAGVYVLNAWLHKINHTQFKKHIVAGRTKEEALEILKNDASAIRRQVKYITEPFIDWDYKKPTKEKPRVQTLNTREGAEKRRKKIFMRGDELKRDQLIEFEKGLMKRLEEIRQKNRCIASFFKTANLEIIEWRGVSMAVKNNLLTVSKENETIELSNPRLIQYVKVLVDVYAA